MELPKKTSSMNKVPFYFYALIVCSMGLFAAYDPSTGTGGGGDVFLDSNNVFTAQNTFLTNVAIKPYVTGDLTGPPALMIGTNSGSMNGTYLAFGVPTGATAGNQAFMQKYGTSRVLEWLNNGILSVMDGGGGGGGSSGAYLDSDELTFVDNGGNVLVQNLTATAASTITLAGGTGPGGNSILRASGVTALTATSNNVSTTLNFGVGTNSPTARIHVDSDLSGLTNLVMFHMQGSGDRNTNYVTMVGGVSGNTRIFDISKEGNVSNAGLINSGSTIQIGGTAVITAGRIFRADVGSVANPGISFGTDADTGLYRPSGNHLGVAVGGLASGVWDSGLNLAVVSNITSRGFGVAVSAISATTNSLLQIFSGTYSGAPATVTFGTVYAAAPAVTVTTTESGGTALGNDTVFVTNITTSTCVIGYRTSAGVSSAATITFNGIALGRQ